MESVFEFVKGNWLNIVGVFFTAVAAIFGVKAYTAATRNKRLTYRVMGNFMLLNPKTSLGDKIKLMYEEKVVDNVSIMFMRLKNEGNVVISKEDFEIPLQIMFDGEGTKVLSTRLLKAEPRDLDTLLTLTFTEEAITIEPIMLNPQDFIDLGVTLAGKNEVQPLVKVRIKGMKGIEISNERRAKLRMGFILMCIIAAMLTFILFMMNTMLQDNKVQNIILLYVYLFTSTLASLTVVRLAISKFGWKGIIPFNTKKNAN